MKRISIQGVITGAIPSILSEFAEDGILTPSNLFTRALREAEQAGEDVEVWINSPGGEVDAANEMLAAFQSFKGYKCVTVGGLAASAAAYFVLQCGARVECHENTRFMFHGARTLVEAGAGALRDCAEAIDRINGPIKEALKARGMDSERVDEGFQDDRALWLDAKEALALGIVQKIAKGATAKLPRPAESALSAVAKYVPAVAALYAAAAAPKNTRKTSAEMNDDENKPADPADNNPPATDPAKDGGAAPAPAPASSAPDGSPAPAAALPDAAATLAASLAKAEALAAATLKRAETAEKALAAAKATIAEYEAASKAAAAKAESLAAALETEKAQHAALVGRVLGPSAEAPASWPEAIKACDGDLGKAIRDFPALAKAFRAAYGTKQPKA